jgi:hypothetical protein
MVFHANLLSGGPNIKSHLKKTLVLVVILGFLLGFCDPLLYSTKGQTSAVDNSYWLHLASNAWNYFQPGVGVESATGLNRGTIGYPYITDWDLGVYIETIIAANKLGILSNGGNWGADARIQKVLSFLQTRELTSNGLPYQWYQSANGNPWSGLQEATDAGALLLALGSLKNYRPDLADSINSIVFSKTNYSALEQAVNASVNSRCLYDYLIASGFAKFWPNRFNGLASTILNNIASAPTVSTYGAKLPTAKITCDHLFLSVFNIPYNQKLDTIAQLVYSAHFSRYTATGKYGAFSEGNSGLANPQYIYEWVVKDDGTTWQIEDVQFKKVDIAPVIFFKSAVCLLAMFNSSFTKNMVSYVESRLPLPTNGYSNGIDENGRVVSTIEGDPNGLIIQAAEYAISNETPLPTPTSSPSNTPTPSPSSNPTPNPSPSPSHSPTPSPTSSQPPNPSTTPNPTPTPTSSPSNTPAPSPSSNPTPNLSPSPFHSPTPSPTSSQPPSPSITPNPTPSPTSSNSTPNPSKLPFPSQPPLSPSLSPTITGTKQVSGTATEFLLTALILLLLSITSLAVLIRRNPRLLKIHREKTDAKTECS